MFIFTVKLFHYPYIKHSVESEAIPSKPHADINKLLGTKIILYIIRNIKEINKLCSRVFLVSHST